MKATVVLSPGAAKRLIAKGVAAHPLVRSALKRGTLVITLGTTNAYVADEVLGKPIDHGAFAAGLVDDRWNLNARFGETTDLVLKHGEPIPFELESLLDSLGSGDVVVKGGNALDPFGTVGVLMAAGTGGTVGRYIPTALARGVEIVVPISLAKSVHTSIADLALEMGSQKIDLAAGFRCGIYPLTGHVITEVDALEWIFSVRAIHVASGGIGPGRGSVSLLLDGEEANVRKAFDAIGALERDEEPVQGRR